MNWFTCVRRLLRLARVLSPRGREGLVLIGEALELGQEFHDEIQAQRVRIDAIKVRETDAGKARKEAEGLAGPRKS